MYISEWFVFCFSVSGRRFSEDLKSSNLSWNNDVIQREILNLPSPVPTRAAAESKPLPQPVPKPVSKPVQHSASHPVPFSRNRHCNQSNQNDYDLQIPTLDWRELGEVIDKRNVFTKRRDRENPFFISEDRQENDDINDAAWDRMRSLRNDQDRKLFAMKAFGNARPADPTKNLGYFGYLRKQLSPGLKQYPKFGNFHNLVLKHGRLERLEYLDQDQQQLNSRKRKASGEPFGAPPAKRAKGVIPMSKFEDDLEKIVIGQKRKIMHVRNLKYFVRHWRLNVQETISFYKYYDDDGKVGYEELCKNDATERLFVLFTEFYGVGKFFRPL